MDIAVARRQLDAFLVDNPELEALSSRLARFNIFRVLGIEQAEIRHSNVLAWLLTPGETHGMGQLFLRRFLSRLLLENEFIEVNLSPAEIELLSLDDVEVQREWRNIDIFVHSPGGKWCLIIENKVGSRESQGQLRRYKSAVGQDFPDETVIPVLLSLEGTEPSDEGKEAGYVSISYDQVLGLTDRLVKQHCSRIPEDAQTFLSHYLETLRRLTMQDQELANLCKTIYRRHREAIDLIMQFGSSSQVLDACEEKIVELVDTDVLFRTAGRVWFVPKDMADAQPEVEFAPGWGFMPKKYPVAWWFFYLHKQGKFQLTMEVGPIADPDLRTALLMKIRDAKFSFWEGGLKKGAKFTRILTVPRKLKSTEDGTADDDPDYIKELTAAMWTQAWDKGRGIVEVLRDFPWPEQDNRS